MAGPTLLAGTSGYSFKEWKGDFYPEKLPAKKMLEYYASKLPTVELNYTFHRMPKRTVVDGWNERTPDGFSFVAKASRRITHFSRLKDPADLLSYLYGSLDGLGDKLGCVLYQLPPNFKKDLERLQTFLKELPKGRRAAFEFRHDSWLDEDVEQALREHGAAFVVADTDEDDEHPLLATTNWGYLRLRRENYTDRDLEKWLARIYQTGWERAWIFFKHEEDSAGARFATRMMELNSSQE